MKASKEIISLLEGYLFTLSDKEKTEFANKGYDILHFGDDQETGERVINSILKGRKRAKSSLYTRKAQVPEIGDYSVVVDHRHEPRCLIKCTGFEIKPLSEVKLEFAQEEGEDSGDISEWIEKQRQFFQAQSSRFDERSLVLCETFRLVFKFA